MKKLIALLLCLVLVVSLCACKKGSDSNKTAEGNSVEQNDEATQETTEPLDITTLENYYQDLSEPEVVEDRLSYKIFQAWYDEESLVLDIYFINGHPEPVTSVWFDELSIYNGDMELEEEGELVQGGLISYACVGPVEMKEHIPAGSYRIVTLRMPKDLEGYLVDLSMEVVDSYEW